MTSDCEGLGIGKLLLSRFVKEKSLTTVALYANKSVQGFYEELEFKLANSEDFLTIFPREDDFVEADLMIYGEIPEPRVQNYEQSLDSSYV